MIEQVIYNCETLEPLFKATIECTHDAPLSRKKRLAVLWALANEKSLENSDLTGADLTDAKLAGANLSGADLSGADLSGADLSGAIGIKKESV